jgi:3-hydroxyacyl-CoA dehydrogenase
MRQPISFSMNPFEPIIPLPELTPDEYVNSFDEAFELAPLKPRGGPRVAALLERRVTDARRRWSAAAPGTENAVLNSVRERGVGIVGAGLMGISIAAAFVNAEITVLSCDKIAVARENAPGRVAEELETLRRNRVGVDASKDRKSEDLVAQYFRTTDALAEVATLPVVIEAIPEKTRLKQVLYRQLEANAKAKLPLFTNTSSLTIEELSATLPREDEDKHTSASRLTSFHFFHPAAKRQPVEIAVGSSATPETIAQAVALTRLIGKKPMVVGDGPGFLVNRILQTYLNEALVALDEGSSPAAIENAARRFGMEGAPLRVIDEIGVDVTMHSGASFLKAFPDRLGVSEILMELVRRDYLGRKTKHGFYRYASQSSWAEDATLSLTRAEIDELLGPRNSAAPETPEEFHTEEALALRFAIAMFFEAFRIVEDGIVGSLRESDAALVEALGFPAEKGGVCYWAFSFGVEKILAVAKKFEVLGPRFKAPELLIEVAARLRKSTS